MSYESFFFITTECEFQEATKKGARVLATFMELDTPSQNGRIYRFVEGKEIAKSLIGRTIRYGADWLGKHLTNVPIIGKVETAFREGKKIKGVVHIWNKNIIEKLKAGVKFLFSVGGVAQFTKAVKKGKQIFTTLYNAVCTHLQLLPNNPKGAGFPTAKIHKILEINESYILTDDNLKLCDMNGKCRILNGIKVEFEEALVYEEIIETEIAKDIAEEIDRASRIIARLFIESQS